MRFLTFDAATRWCDQNAIVLDSDGFPMAEVPDFATGYFRIPAAATRLLWFSQTIESALRPWKRSLLWVTGWGIWESSENWHLYYRLRQTYFDNRLLEDAPAHLVLAHEAPDFITLIYLSLNFGWDVFLLTPEDRLRIRISHDGWIAFSYRNIEDLNELKQELIGSKIETTDKL